MKPDDEIYHSFFGFAKVVRVEMRLFSHSRLQVKTPGGSTFRVHETDVCDARTIRNFAASEVEQQRRHDERETKKVIDSLARMIESKDGEIAGLKREIENWKEFMLRRDHEQGKGH